MGVSFVVDAEGIKNAAPESISEEDLRQGVLSMYSRVRLLRRLSEVEGVRIPYASIFYVESKP